MKDRISNIVSVFKVKNYSYYFQGQLFSLIGTWIQSTALGWLVYRLTGSPKILGLMGFINMIPSLIFSYPAGIIADKINIKKGLYITQSLAMIFALILGFLTLTGIVKIEPILLIAFISGVIGSFDLPFRQSFIIQIIPKNLLHNAIALNSMMFNISRIIGPTLAGVIIKFTANEGWCFIINGISFLSILFSLHFIIPYFKEYEEKDFKSSFYDGIKYVRERDYIKYPILFMALLSFIVMPVITLLPVYVKEIKGDASTFGFLLSSIGIGAVISGFEMATKSKAKNYLRIISFFSILYGISLFVLSFVKIKIIASMLLLIAGIGTSRQVIGLNTIIQSLVEDRMRGRVMSLYSLSFTGFAPIGSIVLGYLAGKIGILNTLRFCGLWILVSNFWFYMKMENLKQRFMAKKDVNLDFNVL